MNEFYTADPECLQSVADLRYLFALFGPQAGRYLVAYPDDWVGRVRAHLADLPTIEQARVTTVLRRAAEGTPYLPNPPLSWTEEKRWVENALDLKRRHKPPRIHEVICGHTQANPEAVVFDDLSLPPTADEKIPATPDEYGRVTETLIAISGELFFVDPFLNPCEWYVRVVLKKLLEKVAESKRCESVVCYGRASAVLGEKSPSTWESAWSELLEDIRWPTERKFRVLLVKDETAISKMHGRYLFSVKGGIRLDQGFQRLPKGRTVDVSPVGRAVLDDLLSTYLEGRNDMTVAHEFSPHAHALK